MKHTSALCDTSVGNGRGTGSRPGLPGAWFGLLTVLLIAFSLVAPSSSVHGQARKGKALSGVFGGFAGDTNAPIDIEADRLVISDDKKMAVFSGNVRAAQGDFTLRTPRLEVYYSSKPAAAGAKQTAAGPGGDITRLKAVQKVRVTSGTDQSATGDEALFDVKAQTVVLSGSVVVRQGKNIITGERLFIDLKTNTTRLDPGRGSSKKPARVKMIIHRDAVKNVHKPASKLGARSGTPSGAAGPGTSGWSSRTRADN